MSDTYRSFYVLEAGDTVSGVLMKVHGLSASDVARYLPAVAANNPHLPNLDHVRPGDVLDVELSSHDPALSAHKRGDMEALGREFAALTPDQQRVVCEQPHVVTVALGLMGEPAVNFADAAAYTLGQLVQQYADASRAYGSALVGNYAAGARGTLATELTNAWTLRQPVSDALDRIPKFLQSVLLEEARKVPAPMRFRQGQVLGEVRRLLRLAPRSVGSYQPFSQVLAKYGNVVKNAGRAGAVFSVLIPTAIAAVKSYDAYGTPAFGHVTAEGVGNVAGGLGGAAVGYLACNAVFGVPSGGTSLFWCGIVAGGAAGLLFSKAGEVTTGWLYDKATGYEAPLPQESKACTVPALP